MIIGMSHLEIINKICTFSLLPFAANEFLYENKGLIYGRYVLDDISLHSRTAVVVQEAVNPSPKCPMEQKCFKLLPKCHKGRGGS